MQNRQQTSHLQLLLGMQVAAAATTVAFHSPALTYAFLTSAPDYCNALYHRLCLKAPPKAAAGMQLPSLKQHITEEQVVTVL